MTKTTVITTKFEVEKAENFDDKTLKYILKTIREDLSKYASTYTFESYKNNLLQKGISDLFNNNVEDVITESLGIRKELIESNDKIKDYYNKIINELDKIGEKASRDKEIMKLLTQETDEKSNKGVESFNGLMGRLLKKETTNSPMHTSLIDALTNDVVKPVLSNAIKNGMYHNRVEIPQFKNNMSIPTRGGKKYAKLESLNNPNKIKLSIKMLNKEFSKKLQDGLDVSYKIGGKTKVVNYRSEYQSEWIDFIILTKDKRSREIASNLANDKYKMGSIQIVTDKRGKHYLHIAYHKPVNENKLDENKIMGVDMGLAKPVYMAFNDSKKRYYIDGDEIIHFRKGIDKRRRAILKQGKYAGKGRSGHGRKTKLEPIVKLRDRVENFKNTTNHKYARYVVNMAIKNGCGKIQVENLTGMADGEKKATFLGDWTYFDLQQKIINKAKAEGIEVVKVKAKYTSRRCNRCGHIHINEPKEKWRPTQDAFKCQNEGCPHGNKYYVNADYNAAKNIAMDGIDDLIDDYLKEREKHLKHMKRYVIN